MAGRRKKHILPEFTVKRGADGFPVVSQDDETIIGRKGEFPTVCLLCYSTSAFIAADVRGRLYTYCQACGVRIFTGGRGNTEKLLRAHHRMLQDEDVREYAMRALATQMS